MATDTRVRITKQMIKESFIELLKTNPLNKISVTQICKKAEINRVTFYKYYKDTYDLYEKIIDEMLDTSSHIMTEIYNSKDLRKAIETTISDIKAKIEQYHLLFSDHVDAYHQSKSIECCMQKISGLEMPGLVVSEEQHILLRAFLSFGGGGVLATWMNNGMKESQKEIADLLYSYIMQILKLYSDT